MRKAYQPKVVKPRLPLRAARPLAEFLQSEANSGLLLLGCAAVALLWANSPWSLGYFSLRDAPLSLTIGSTSLQTTVLHAINDGLMALFFLLVGLEIKREVLIGELSTVKRAALPALAALGGMVVPALIYVAFTLGSGTVQGWGVPMATDIAFALGVLALLGSRVPYALKVLLAAVAIADDLGAVLVIALFYGSSLDPFGLLAMVVILFVLGFLNWASVRSPLVFMLVGIALWAATLASGLHATLAGVLLAITIPTKVHMNPVEFADEARSKLGAFDSGSTDEHPTLMTEDRQAAVREIERDCQRVLMPLERIEDGLGPWVRYLVMPVFAFANAGVAISGDVLGSLGSAMPLGILLGLVLGKPLGILGFSFLAVKFKFASLPTRVRWRHVAGMGAVAGIGFTMSLFIAGLAFGDAETLDLAKVAVLVASTVAGLLGYALLSIFSRSRTRRTRRTAT